jgi:plastocyanin
MNAEEELMKLDLTKLPIGEMMIGFMVLALGVTFALAYTYVDSGETAPEATAAPTGGGTETPSPGGTEIVMHDNRFDPTEITVTAGETVTIAISNEGAILHNLHIASIGGNFAASLCETGGDEPCSDPAQVRGGATATLTWDVPADAAGTEVPFRCDFHPVEMTGTITIQ